MNKKHSKDTRDSRWFSTLLLALVAAMLITTLTGCASTFERARDHFDEGRLDQALGLIEKARTEYPADPDTVSLELRIRRQWVADKLIQVRLLRLADNHGASGDLLRLVLTNQTKWSMVPVGAVFATQAEEVHYFALRIQSGIREALQQDLPLLAASRLDRDRVLLEETLKIDTAKLKAAVGSQIAVFCSKESRQLSAQDFYGSVFLKKTCDTFRVAVPIRPTKNSVRLFQNLKPAINVQGLPEETTTALADEMAKAFKKSLWFDQDPMSQAQALGIAVKGQLTEKISEREVYRSKPFTVQVPYEERSVRKKEERSGLGMLFEVLAWAVVSNYRPNREVDNGDGTVTVYETKYRSETRYHTYAAKEFTQTLAVDWSIDVHPQGGVHQFAFKDSFQLVSDEHGVRFPDADIVPETRKLLRPADWVRTLNPKLFERVADELNQAWIAQFCLTESESRNLSETERRHRCVYGAGTRAPAQAASWFSKRYGIEIETWRQQVERATIKGR